MEIPLFRQQVLENQSGKFAGAIVLTQPVPMQVAATVSAVLVVALLVFLVTGHYTRSVTVQGQLVPVAGATKTTSPQFGRIVAIHVREGDIVAEGQLLFEVSSERSTRDGGVEYRASEALLKQRELSAVESEVQLLQLAQKRRELQARLLLAHDETSIAERERALQRRRIEIAGEMLARSRSLRDQGFVSAAQVAQSEAEHLEHETRLQATERSRLSSLREHAQVASELAQLERQADIIRLQGKRNRSALEQGLAEHQARMNVEIHAQMPGKVTAVAVHLGATVEAGANLATIVPQDGVFEAHLSAPSDSIGFAVAQQGVRMRVAAYPYQKFGYLTGKVRVVESGPVAETLVGNKNATEPLYRIAVTLDRQSIYADGQERPFKPGMRLEAVIRQDRRRLIQWLFDPIRNVIKTPV